MEKPTADSQMASGTPGAAPAGPQRAAVRNARKRREGVLQKLEEHFAAVVTGLDADQDGYKREDRALKITKLLSFMDERIDEVAADLAAMQRFVRFCLRELSEQEMQPVRKAVRLYMEELRRDAR